MLKSKALGELEALRGLFLRAHETHVGHVIDTRLGLVIGIVLGVCAYALSRIDCD